MPKQTEQYYVTDTTTVADLTRVMLAAHDSERAYDLEIIRSHDMGDKPFHRLVNEARKGVMRSLTDRHALRLERGDFESYKETMVRTGMKDEEYAAFLLN